MMNGMDTVNFFHFTALGFDFGLKRIGVAVGQTLTQSANPIAILKAKHGIPNWEKVRELIETWKVDLLVVGMPYNMDGSEQCLTHATRKFINKLKLKSGLPVHTVDERLTTIEAKRLLWFEHKFQKKFKMPQEFDSYASKLILEQWLQENVNRIK